MPLWLESTAYDLAAGTPEGRDWIARHERPDRLLKVADDKHEFRFHYMQ